MFIVYFRSSGSTRFPSNTYEKPQKAIKVPQGFESSGSEEASSLDFAVDKASLANIEAPMAVQNYNRNTSMDSKAVDNINHGMCCQKFVTKEQSAHLVPLKF